MDIGQRASRPASSSGQSTSSGSSGSHSGSRSSKKGIMKIMRLSSLVLLFSATILVVAMILFLVFGGGKNNSESGYVATDKYQAVFMNGGQVYFGKITELNSKFLTLQDIYYLQVDQQVQPDREGQAQQNDITLVKLGCELHGPQDLMVVKQDQVIFWENLKDDGRVSEAIAQFQSQNPNGLQCDEGNASTDANAEE